MIDGNPSILELDTTHAEISGMVLNDRVGKKERMEITFDGDNMTIKCLNPRAIGKGLIYTRVR